jgi:D-threonate/D-erythronate kinase
VMPSAAQLECLLIADDVTGACDSAVQFAAAGLRVFVPLAHNPELPADVLAFSTDSRDIDPAEASCRIRMLAGMVEAFRPRILYKKIDSILRGNSGVETVAAIEAFGCDTVVVNPAFPAMGRIVRGGCLAVPRDPAFGPIELSRWLHANGAQSGARIVLSDAVCDEDLTALAAELLASNRRTLWVGSGGLAAALARQLGGDRVPPGESPAGCGPVWFCIGSDHPVTTEQQRRLAERQGVHVILPVRRGQPVRELPDCRPAAIFLCGGDTASAVLAALGARSIELRREFAPGIPQGILHGGDFDGVPLLTKSGAFGEPDDLVRIAEYFHA